jgi:acyl-CoA reductase-like NAD-dependent aldehyde dehydrogenase
MLQGNGYYQAHALELAAVLYLDDATRSGGQRCEGPSATTPLRDCTPRAASTPGRESRPLTADLGRLLRPIKYGTPDREMEIGPLISERQRSRVSGFVERARAQKHTEVVTVEGKVGPGFSTNPR